MTKATSQLEVQYSTLPERILESEFPETAAQHPPHEGLQPEQAGKIPWAISRDQRDHEEKQRVDEHRDVAHGRETRRRRCGLVPRLFWLLVGIGVALVAVAAVVGGVVGSGAGGSGEQESAAAEGATSSSRTSAQPTATSAVPSQTTSSEASLATQTLLAPGGRNLYRDCPSSDDDIYTYGGAASPMIFRKWCNKSCYNTQGWTAMINQDTSSLNDCIDLCAAYNLLLNQTSVIDAQSSSNGSVCNTVCWRWNPRDPDWPGHCFGFTSLNVSGHWNISAASECDSAGWISQYF